MDEQYRVWCPDLGEQEDDCTLFMAYDEGQAARDFAEKSYHDEPYEQAMILHVRCTRSGSSVRVFAVHPEPTISFYSYEQDVPA